MRRALRIVGFALLSSQLGAPGLAAPTCLPIDRVRLNGTSVVPSQVLAQAVAPFEGRCLGLAEFDQILEAVTTTYVDHGYVLSRAYLPEQDLTTRQLQVAVVEGELVDVRINGRHNPRLERAAFPGQRGKPAHIRRVEQGLDQLEAMPRWGAQMEFAPGDQVGQSVLNVTAKTPKPFEFKLSSNNRGNDQPGRWITTAALDWTNMLGMADSWSLSYSKNLSPGPLSFGYQGDSSRSFSAEVKLPYGRWRYSANIGTSHNRLTIPGAIAPINTRGNSWNGSFTAQYLLHRNQTSKTHGALTLNHSASQNYIQNVLIKTSSRALTNLRLSVDHERPLWGGTLKGSLHVEKGVSWFKSENARTMPAGSPNAQYALLGLNADWRRSFDGTGAKTELSFTLSGQASHDRLYGGQQFSLGGASTVRGTRISLANGSSGVLLRSEATIAPTALDGSLFKGSAVYGALDMGRIAGQPRIGVKPAYAVGGAIGLKAQIGKKVDLDVSYQRILARSSRLQSPKGEVFVSVGVTF